MDVSRSQEMRKNILDCETTVSVDLNIIQQQQKSNT